MRSTSFHSDRILGVIRRARSQPGFMTAALTAIVTVGLVAAVVFLKVDTRNARGEHREMPVIDVWREMLDNLPSQAPDLLGKETLGVLLVIALIASAYVIVATWRLPR